MPSRSLSAFFLMAAVISSGCALVSCRQAARTYAADSTSEFGNPQRVVIEGYNGDAMEPFLSRDGRYLFFNNLNDPAVNTDLYWAERIDDLHFMFRGEVQGVNTPALEGVPSMDRDGNFYFVSNRSYDQTASTLYRGRFGAGAVNGVELVPGVSLATAGIVNFDAEIGEDGNALYFVESRFNASGRPQWARILLARRSGNRFVRDPASASLLKTIDAGVLNYAPATSSSECELYFTRADSSGPAIYVARRHRSQEPFGEPLRIAAITGFAEAPTVSPDGLSVYFHRKENGRFAIFRVTRNAANQKAGGQGSCRAPETR